MPIDATSSARAHDHAWRVHVARVMPELRARQDDVCAICGGPVDFGAPARSSRSPSVDHIVPVHAGGVHCPPVDELRLVHFGCNSRRGARTRAMQHAVARSFVSVVEVLPDLPVGRRGRSRSYKEDLF